MPKIPIIRSKVVYHALTFILAIASFLLDASGANQRHTCFVHASFAFHKYPHNLYSSLAQSSFLISQTIKNGDNDFQLFMAKKSTEQLTSQQWLPSVGKSNDDIFASDSEREQLEHDSIELVANIISMRINDNDKTNIIDIDEKDQSNPDNNTQQIKDGIVRNRFRDLTCKDTGENILEDMFLDHASTTSKESRELDVLRGSIIAMQSLLIMGMQVGVKGSLEMQQRMVAHLYRNKDVTVKSSRHVSLQKYFDDLTPRQLKHQVDTTAGTQILSNLKRKRSAQGAFDLLVQLGVWDKHEDIALLRSGFPLRFTDEEINDAIQAETEGGIENLDPDELLGLRQDFRSMKVYTIDSEFTSEIDDGLSIESITKKDGSQRNRIWVHIADADKWAPRGSNIFHTAKSRSTSVYTPAGSIPMFPTNLSSGVMSLRADCDSHALSLGVELNDDGSIDEKTITVTPSLIKVDYRLTYDEVDEMLEMGVGYFEEWELGALLSEANKRRGFRISKGSTEGFVPKPIPHGEIRVEPNAEAEDEIDVILRIEGSHNAGYNQSSTDLSANDLESNEFEPPVSSSALLVTEMMILSGEAMGKFQKIAKPILDDEKLSILQLKNELDLPFRSQAKPNFSKRYQEINTLESLKDKGYCHAWYARRFFESVQVVNEFKPHYGLGLDCYVQWSSPIRRFGDLQVHAAVKRFLRRSKVNILMRKGESIPATLSDIHLGCDVPQQVEDSKDRNGKFTEYIVQNEANGTSSDLAISWKKGLGFIKAARIAQNKSKQYWLFEYVRRMIEKSSKDVVFDATVLALVDPNRYQYVIFIHELGLEHKYLSETGQLSTGSKLKVKVASVSPRHGLLTFTVSSKSHDRGNYAGAA